MMTRRTTLRRGVTLIELLLAMVVGLVVLGTATAYVGTTDRTLTAAANREDYARKARFLGLAFRRDFGEAGVGVESLRGFGTVAAFNDTITILKVPYEPNADPAYNIALNPIGTTNATTQTASNCGARCVRLRRTAPGVPLTLEPGMLARIQRTTVRRLILVTAVGNPGGANDSIAVNFRSVTSILGRRSITTAAPLTGISNTNTTVQRLELVAYWRDASNNLWRATRLDPTSGAMIGELVATGCLEFRVRLTFRDGGIAANADSTVADRWYTDINSIIVTATLAASSSDPRINGGQPLKRTYTFRIQPRNLLYERNR